MSVATNVAISDRVAGRTGVAEWVVPASLFAVAFAVRVLGSMLVRFPMTEGSAYYTTVAQNLASGRGLVIDSIWSYATPPLTLPRPAFELWQPLASLIAAAPMPVLGATYSAAQLSFAIIGALVAPLAWFLARDAARRLELPPDRAASVSVGAGLIAAVFGPFVLAVTVPDSTLPFTVLAVAACITLPHAVAGDRHTTIALGVLCGLAYLTRMDAIYLGVAFVAAGWTVRARWSAIIGRAAVVAVVAALVALPWWLRNWATFGTALPGQVADNAFLTRNEQIFAFADPPTVASFLGQGAATTLTNIGEAFRHDLVNVLLIPGAAVTLIAVASVIIGRARARELRGSPLAALLILGVLTLVVTSLVFPVATLWGTFEHAAGPLLVAFVVLAALGGDALVARVRRWRNWPRANAWLAPATVLALTIPLTLLQLTGAGIHSSAEQERFAGLSVAIPEALATADVDTRRPLVSDRPVWLANALGGSAVALPDEPAAEVLSLARSFGAHAVVVVEERGRHPAALAADRQCFREVPLRNSQTNDPTRVFVIEEACR